VAANALTATEMSTGCNLANLRSELISSGADALLFSGGGDDLFLQRVYPPATAVSAFEWFLNPAAGKRVPINQKRFDRFLSDLQRAIQRIAAIATQYNLPCFLHTYAVPIPSGRGAYPYPGFGPWIRPVLIKRGYDPTWMWQEGLRQVNVKNIPYSDFKQFRAEGKVVECSVGEAEIVGRIDPARQIAGNSKPATATQTGPSAASPASEKNQKPASEKTPPKPYFFLTIRVDDPNLAAELAAAKIQFTGMRSGLSRSCSLPGACR
jgi:hypothetical protein